MHALNQFTYHNFFAGCSGSITIVVTPLTALMMDQKQKFSHRSLSVEFVGEAQCDEGAITAVVNGNVQLVYINPENLLNNRRFRNMLLGDKYKHKLVGEKIFVELSLK